MANYHVEDIRNIALVGHGAAGSPCCALCMSGSLAHRNGLS